MRRVLGIGNALVDILVRISDDNLLGRLMLPRGSMQLVNRQRSDQLLEAVSTLKQEIASGGSAANTIHGIACLGGKPGYIGTIGRDTYGSYFVEDLNMAGVLPKMFYSDNDTGRAVTLISPDSERTFATWLGAAVELSADHLREDDFRGYDILHLEGYLVQNHALVEQAVRMAAATGMKISLDLASYNVVEANLDFLRRIVEQYVDILFANEEEARSFTGKDPQEALAEMSGMADIAVLKAGSKGSMISSKGNRFEIGVIPVVPVDTTGAGDLYASGFLYGLSQNMKIEQCGRLGALLAGNVIGYIGAKMPPARWNQIREQMTL